MNRSCKLIGGPGDGDEFPVHGSHLFPEVLHVPGYTGRDEKYYRVMISFEDEAQQATYVHRSFRGYRPVG